jgi:hypothetical protein
VAKSRKAWQTMKQYPTWISEVHQTYPGHTNFCGHEEHVWGIPFPKKKKWKGLFSWEKLQEQVSDYNLKSISNKWIDYKLTTVLTTKFNYK